MSNYIKSCINYTGGKFKLLKQIIPLFPQDIEVFVDLFCGGGNVGLNVTSNIKIFNDKQENIISLFNTIKNNDISRILYYIENIIETYQLSNTYINDYLAYDCQSSKGLAEYNKNSFLELREEYNNYIKKNDQDTFIRDMMLYTLIIYSFNNQIRFNKKNEYNIPVGKRDFNAKNRKNLVDFKERITNDNITFISKDFREFNFKILNEKDFIYIDPPYLLSNATYNEQGGWTENDERDLLKILDKLNQNNIRFALSNVLESKGKENFILKEWAKKYKVNYLNYNYNNSNYQKKDRSQKNVEVLITNY